MPRLSDTMEEGNIVGWLKSVGDQVEPGDVLAEVETDKATMELESFLSGTLLYIGQKEGAVPVDGIIAIIGDKGESYEALLKEAQESGGSAAEKEEVKEEPAAPTSTPAPPAPVKSAPAPVAAPVQSEGGRIKASPLAKSMASEAGLNIEAIPGTGEGGRIIKKDVEDFIASGGAHAAPIAGSAAPMISLDNDVQYGDVPVTQMRKVIASRLGESKFTAPHFYLTVVGVAVAVPDGLLVPVINNADQKSMTYINQEVRTLAGKAKEKKLQPAEMSGNTFTISNLGMFGIEEFTAIINGPDSCILAVGSIVEKPIVKDGQIVVGNIMKVTLSCDHRTVDGASGAMFLQTLRGMLENPVRMLV